MNTNLAVESFEYNNEEKWFKIILKCTDFVSVNTAHGYKLKGQASARVFDTPETNRFKNELTDQLIFADPRKKCPWITNHAYYSMCVKYIFKRDFNSRDLDNVHKYTQDMLAKACAINDSHIVEVHMWKNYRPGDYEYMLIQFGISNYDFNQFN